MSWATKNLVGKIKKPWCQGWASFRSQFVHI